MRLLCQCLAVLLAIAMASVDARAQSVLRDAETEALLAEMAAPLVEAAGLQPGNVDIVLIHDPSINPFVAGGQAVYINRGLIHAAATANTKNGNGAGRERVG